MTPGERVAFEPSLMAMLAQHFHHAAVVRDVIVVALDAAHQASVLDVEHVAEAIRVGFVGTEQAEVMLLGIAREDIAHHLAEGSRRFDLDAAGLLELHRVVGERGDVERDGQDSAVGVRIRAHPAISFWRDRFDLRLQSSAFIEQLVGPVTAHPIFEQFQMLGIFLDAGKRHLMGAEGSFDLHAVNDLRPGPSLERSQDDRRPRRPLPKPVCARIGLNRANRRVALVERRRELAMHLRRVIALDKVDLVAMALEQETQFLVLVAAEHGGTGNFVAVQMEDRQHRAVTRRVEKLYAFPSAFERPGLRLAIADHARDNQIGIVERRAERMHQRIAELAAFVDRPRHVRARMTRHAARRRELAKQEAHTLGVLGNPRINLGVRTLEIGVRHDRRSAVAGTGYINDVGVVLANQPVEMHVDKILPRRSPPMPKQTRLDVLGPQRLAQ